jgi:hypothetical protein
VAWSQVFAFLTSNFFNRDKWKPYGFDKEIFFRA